VARWPATTSSNSARADHDGISRHGANRDPARCSERAHLHNADSVLSRIIDARPDFDAWAWMAELPAMNLYGALLFQIPAVPCNLLFAMR
jgi:hypothetical protein